MQAKLDLPQPKWPWQLGSIVRYTCMWSVAALKVLSSLLRELKEEIVGVCGESNVVAGDMKALAIRWDERVVKLLVAASHEVRSQSSVGGTHSYKFVTQVISHQNIPVQHVHHSRKLNSFVRAGLLDVLFEGLMPSGSAPFAGLVSESDATL